MILAWKTQFHMACKKGQFDVVELMLNNQFQGFFQQFCQKLTREIRARGNRKILKCIKIITKSNFRTLKLKSHEE